VSNAFLHGHLDEQVFCQHPTDFVDPEHPDAVCLLSRSLYGLRQAPRASFQSFVAFVTSIGFRQTRSDSSLFVYRNGRQMAYLLLYVDGMVLTASTTTLLEHLIQRLHTTFAVKDMGPVKYFLGIDVKRNSDGFFLSQSQCATDLLERVGMSNCKPADTPVHTKQKVSSDDGNLLPDGSSYRSLAGALQYLTITRPDIAYAVQQVCLHMHAPRDCHLALLKRALRYSGARLRSGCNCLLL